MSNQKIIIDLENISGFLPGIFANRLSSFIFNLIQICGSAFQQPTRDYENILGDRSTPCFNQAKSGKTSFISIRPFFLFLQSFVQTERFEQRCHFILISFMELEIRTIGKFIDQDADHCCRFG